MKRKYFIYWFVYCMGLVSYTSYLRHNTAYLWNIASIFTVILAKIECSRLSVITIAPMNIASVFNNQSQFCLSVFSVCFCYQRCRCSTFIYGLFWNHNAFKLQYFRTYPGLKGHPRQRAYAIKLNMGTQGVEELFFVNNKSLELVNNAVTNLVR